MPGESHAVHTSAHTSCHSARVPVLPEKGGEERSSGAGSESPMPPPT
jgi:hypothetical protein